jgi:glycosyltransferase involved in cell wall biosynthesis
MKIIHVTAIDTTISILLRSQLKAFKDSGYEVHTVSSSGPSLDSLREEGFICHELPIPRSANPIHIIRSIILLWRLFKKEKFDIMHAHTPVASVSARIAAKIAGIKHIFYTAHGFYFHENMQRALYLAHLMIERFMGSITTHLFVQSEEDYETAWQKGIIKKDKLTYIGNGVDEKRFSASQMVGMREATRKELCYKDEDFVFAFIGRLVEEKGVKEMVSAAAIVCKAGLPARFLIIGSNAIGDRDSFAEHIKEQIDTLKINDRFYFTGFTNNVPNFLIASDTFMLPSYREGLPRSIIEAMHLGLPVISTNIRGPREEVLEGITGYLVPAKSAIELSEAMKKMLLSSKEEVSKMGEAGRLRAMEFFCERMVVERILTVYRNIK